jgi:hypothetical protein
MKTIVNKLFLLTFFSVALWGCKKDETLTTIANAKVPVLSSSATALVLTEANKANAAVTFSWTAADYGFKSAVKYTLQIAKAGTSFAAPKDVAIDAGKLTLGYTVEEINTLLNISGYQYGVSTNVEFRVKADVNNAIAPVYSNVTTVAITPYEIIIVYPTWYVAGTHQADPIVGGVKVKGFYSNPGLLDDYGWFPATAPKIMSLFDNKVYKGYVNFPDAVNEFKFVPVPSWSGDLGGTNTGVDAGGVNTGTVGGGNNAKVLGAGYYLVEFDDNTKTYKASPRRWGVIGDATPTGWGSDTDLVYNPVTGTLEVTLALTGGKGLKFRPNDDWAGLDVGDGNADGVLDQLGNNNINVAVSGTYKIVMDLRNFGKLKYTLTKL